LINDCEISAIATIPESVEKKSDLLAGEDVWQWLVAFDFDLFPDLPTKAEMIAVERAQRADRLIDSGRAELAFVLEMNEEIKNLRLIQIGQIAIREMRRELIDPAEISFSRAFPQSF